MREEPVLYVRATNPLYLWNSRILVAAYLFCASRQQTAPAAYRGRTDVLWAKQDWSLEAVHQSAPHVQINGRPFVVREADKPFQNLEYTGIDRSRVEDMESRLKADVLKEVRHQAVFTNEIAGARQALDCTAGCCLRPCRWRIRGNIG